MFPPIKPWPLIVLLIGCALPWRASAQTPAEVFFLGVAQFRDENYESAIDTFLEAQEMGYAGSDLRYNLGVSYFKLGQFDKSHNAFLGLRDHPSLGAIAEYNLGLIALRQGHIEVALTHFARSLEKTQDPRIQQLSRNRIDAIEGQLADTLGASQVATLGVGYIDNLGDPIDNSNTRVSSSFLEGSYAQSLTWTDDLQADVSLYGVQYPNHGDFNFLSLHAQLQWNSSTDLKNLIPSLLGEINWLAADHFQDILGGQLKIPEIPLAMRPELRLQLRWFHSDRQYRFLDGEELRVRIQTNGDTQPIGRHLGYEWIINQRRDQRTADRFSSYSPRHHRFYYWGEFQGPNAWRYDLQAEWRHSDYPDPERFSGGDTLRRRDHRIRLVMSASYPLFGQTRLYVQARHTDNRSNIANFDFRSSDLLTGFSILY